MQRVVALNKVVPNRRIRSGWLQYDVQEVGIERVRRQRVTNFGIGCQGVGSRCHMHELVERKRVGIVMDVPSGHVGMIVVVIQSENCMQRHQRGFDH